VLARSRANLRAAAARAGCTRMSPVPSGEGCVRRGFRQRTSAPASPRKRRHRQAPQSPASAATTGKPQPPASRNHRQALPSPGGIGKAPACMRCGGLARSLAAGLPVARLAGGLLDRLLVPDSRPKRRFPGSSCVPGLPPDWCPSPAVTYFYPPGRVRHKGSRAVISGFFSCPQPIHSRGSVVPSGRCFSTRLSTTSAQAASLAEGMAWGLSLGYDQR
jgi:hypothetical protein